MPTTYGTDNQNHYVSILRARLGEDAVAEATRAVLGMAAGEPLPDSISVESTSGIIERLKVHANKGGANADPSPSPAARPGPKRMSGRELLALAELDASVPTDLDPDMAKVVSRLRRMTALRGIIRSQDAPMALNGKEPIQVAVFVRLLGGAAEAAKSLGVTIKTLEGWGEYLPDSHESRAELVTGGAVKARLPA